MSVTCICSFVYLDTIGITLPDIDGFSSPVLPVGSQTPSSAPQQEEEAGDGGASSSAGPQTPAEWSSAAGCFPGHSAEGETSVCFYNSQQFKLISVLDTSPSFNCGFSIPRGDDGTLESHRIWCYSLLTHNVIGISRFFFFIAEAGDLK